MAARRLAIISPVFPSYHGGMGVVAQHHASLFAARGYVVHVYTPTAASASAVEQRDGFTIHWLPSSFAYGNAGHIDLSDAFENNDIIHLHFPFYFSAEQCIRLRKKFTNKKFFITYHMDPIAGGLKGLFFWFYSMFMTHRILATADKIFVSTRAYAEAASNGAYFRAHPYQIIEAPFGVDLEQFTPQTDRSIDVRTHYQLAADVPILLFVGGMDTPHYFKGIPLLLEAFTRCREPAQLVLVGDGDLRTQFEKQAAVSGKNTQIHFVGSVSREELALWYRTADIFVLPSINRSEAFGLVLLEAMASGVACIASDLPGVSTVLDHGKSGVLFPAGDSTALAKVIDALLCDKDRRAQLAFAANQRVAQVYTWSRMAGVYETWYTVQ